MRPILIIDALNLFSRHYVRNPAMSTLGHQMGGVVGFLNALKDLTQLVQPETVIVVWEGGGSIRKRALFSGYKADRRPPRLNRYYEDDIPDTQENRLYQVKTLVSLLKSLPVCQLFVEDCEADDVIGYLCRNKFINKKKIIASSDKDFYQLLNDLTMIYSWTSKRFIGPDEITEQMKITPENFAVAKAVCGDPSDAVPGVKGVGFKVLAKRFDLMSRTITVTELVDAAFEQMAISNVKVYAQIYENRDLIKRNFRLMYLDVGNLAAVQVRKIDASVDSFKPTKNKMQLMRGLLDEGLGAFDSHELFSAFIAV